MILKHPLNGSLQDISTLLLAAGPQRKLMKTLFCQLWRSSIYQLFLLLSAAAEPHRELMKLQIQGYVQAKLASIWLLGGVTTIYKNVCTDCILHVAHPLVRQRACSQFWQQATSSFLHSLSNSSTNCKNTQWTLKHKHSGPIVMAGVTHEKSRRRLCKRIGWMKSGGEGTGGQYGGLAMLQTEQKFHWQNKWPGEMGVARVANWK